MKFRDTILLVDDSGSSRTVLKRIFSEKYYILEAENGAEAVMQLKQNSDCIAAVLLDIVMPVMDGFAVLEEMKETGYISEIPVVVITSIDSNEGHTRVLKLGASDMILKPFDPIVIQHRVQNIIDLYRHKWHLEEMVDEQAQKMHHANEVMVDALSSIIETRSMESGQHVLRMRRFTKIIAEEVAKNCPEYELDRKTINRISSAAALHDIGKISIPDSILNKPGRLTAEEFEVMKTHTTEGCRMIETLDGVGDREYLYYAYNICRYHHERWNGAGYPDKLEGDAIPICAQVAGLADVYDALMTERVYKPAYSHEKAMEMILGGECGVFSEKLLECFKNVSNDLEGFAKLYSDGFSYKDENYSDYTDGSEKEKTELNAFQTLQAAHQTMLHHMKAAVMEADLDGKTYHMVYNPYLELSSLEKKVSISDLEGEFAEDSVHPMDRDVLKGFLKYCDERFMQDGGKQCECRVRVKKGEGWQSFRITVVRVEKGKDAESGALVFWQPQESVNDTAEDSAYAVGKKMLEGIAGAFVRCRNDRSGTLLDGAEDVADITGFTLNEITGFYGNKLVEIMAAEDREEFLTETGMQRPEGSMLTLQYRLQRKNGVPVWILDRRRFVISEDKGAFYDCFLTDITNEKRLQERINLLSERQQIFMRHTNNVIFEWDLDTDTIEFSDNWKKKYGHDLVVRDAGIRLIKSRKIHPNDRKKLEAKAAAVLETTKDEMLRVRLWRGDGRFVWCEVRAGCQRNIDGMPLKIVGVIIELDDKQVTPDKRGTR